jgi:hypothetical protein
MAVFGALILALFAARPVAHDIPADVLVQAFVRPEGSRLTLVMRVPLASMRDIKFPLYGTEFLDIPKAEPALREAAGTWIDHDVELYEGDTRLQAPKLVAVRVALPSDRAFASFDQALAGFQAPPLTNDTPLPWTQAMMDVHYEYAIASDRSRFSIRPSLARLGLRVVTVLRFLPPDSPERAFEYRGDPGLVRLDPRWHQAALRFVALGFEHILDGVDHLLFLACLVIPFRRPKQLIIIVTSFTVAHSVTLIASAFGFAPDALWFPPLVETLIATSIVYMALENIVGVTDVGRRWALTFAFGLVHGFGFSFALRETLQFAGSHLVTSLLSFNLGVELGQLLVLAIMLPALQLVFRYVVAERVGVILLSALIAHTAWHWMLDRGSTLVDYDWPAPGPEFYLAAVRWLMAAVAVMAIVWLVKTKGRAKARPSETGAAADSRP